MVDSPQKATILQLLIITGRLWRENSASLIAGGTRLPARKLEIEKWIKETLNEFNAVVKRKV
jgi:hypothetical protein